MEGGIVNTRLAQSYGYVPCDALDEVSRRDIVDHAADRWTEFYQRNANNFFRDRHWLTREFPILGDTADLLVCDLGCGVGNSLFPLLQEGAPGMRFYCCDFASSAIDVLKKSPLFDAERILVAFVADVSRPEQVLAQVPAGVCDCVLLIFVLSAMPRSAMQGVIEAAYRVLRVGGCVLFRDYADGDAAQHRFLRTPGSRVLEPRLCVRGDGTQAYFFLADEVKEMWTQEGRFVARQCLVVDHDPPAWEGPQDGRRLFVQANFEKIA